jgi:hypothetical protein
MMTDNARAARDDLAFMKELVEDRGTLPSILGAHLLAVGAPFGLNVIYAWAGMAAWNDCLPSDPCCHSFQ